MDNQPHKDGRWRHVLPRIYLDTCVLADVVLEDAVSASNDTRLRERVLAQTIFPNWPVPFLTSPYVIGELFRIGQRKFSKTPEEMKKTLAGRVYPRCDVLFAEQNLTLDEAVKTMESVGFKSRTIVEIEYVGTAVWKDYRAENATGRLVVMRLPAHVSVARSVLAGLPIDHPDEVVPSDAKFEDVNRVTVKAPAFELMLFEQAAGWVHELGVSWSDAFHFVYATWAQCDCILTTDNKLVEQCEEAKHRGPYVTTPSRLCSRLPPELLRELGCPAAEEKRRSQSA